MWAEGLYGEHRAGYRLKVLVPVESGLDRDGTVMETMLLSSVRVLGEGVDLQSCDAVFFADVRGSMPGLVQAVGRALRIRPGEDKVATLLVPVFHEHPKTAGAAGARGGEDLLTSPAYEPLAKLLMALRAHDDRIAESLPTKAGAERPREPGERAVGEGVEGLSRMAAELLQFARPRDPAELAAFMELRVVQPERAAWRRLIGAAGRYHAEHGDLDVPFGDHTPASWDGVPGQVPLGRLLTLARRAYAEGRLTPAQIRQLDRYSMVWARCSRQRGTRDTPTRPRGPRTTDTSARRWTPPGTNTPSARGRGTNAPRCDAGRPTMNGAPKACHRKSPLGRRNSPNTGATGSSFRVRVVPVVWLGGRLTDAQKLCQNR